MIIRGHEDVLRAEIQSDERGLVDPRWGVVVASAEEVLFLSTLFYCDIGPYSVRYKLQCVFGMNVMFAKRRDETCNWAGIMHHDT